MKFKNKNIIITGGSNGIGKAIALSLAKQGANIIITYCNDNIAADKVVREIESFGVRAIAIKVNLSESVDRTQLEVESYTAWKKRIESIPLNRTGTHEEIAQAVEFCITNKWMTGSTVTIDGGRSVNWLGDKVIKPSDHPLRAKL